MDKLHKNNKRTGIVECRRDIGRIVGVARRDRHVSPNNIRWRRSRGYCYLTWQHQKARSGKLIGETMGMI